MEMTHKTEEGMALINGLVLDHGSRQPDMSKVLKDVYILCLNVSPDYEKSTVNSTIVYNRRRTREAC